MFASKRSTLIQSLRIISFTTFALIIVMFFPKGVLITNAQINWTGEYTADNFPQESSPAWTALYDNHTCYYGFNHLESISNGILNIWRKNGWVYFNSGNVLEAPATVEFKMKVNYSYINIPQRCATVYFSAGPVTVSVCLYPDKIEIAEPAYSSVINYSMDTTDRFHVYRFLLDTDKSCRVYIDNEYIGTVITKYPSLTGPWGDTYRKIIFGEGGTYCREEEKDSQSEWDFVRYFNGAAIPPSTNNVPFAEAGENISISSEEISTTTIQGSASDEDLEDLLYYRWLKGETILLDWTSVNENSECSLDLSLLSIGIGSQVLTLEVTDGQATSTDDMILTIENSAPHAAPTGGGVYEIFSNVTIGGQVSDFDGDQLDFTWLEDGSTLFSGQVQCINGGDPVVIPDNTITDLSLGFHALTLSVDDGVNDHVMSDITVEIVDTGEPTLAPVPNKTILWPPNHQMVDIMIEANASDNSGSQIALSATVSSNESEDGLGDGDMSPDWSVPVIDQNNGIITLRLRSERSGSGDGRIYTITITATDGSANSSQSSIEIIVPHDKSKK